jgi:hypothetical protein
MEAYIKQAKDINNSDIDFVDVNGTVYIVCARPLAPHRPHPPRPTMRP